MDRRVFTRAVKVNQSWVIPESGIPHRIQLLLKSTIGVPSLSLPRPHPLADSPAHLSLRRTI